MRLALAAVVMIAAGPAWALGARLDCGGGAVGSIAYPDPTSAVLRLGTRSISMHIAPSGSGARYVGRGTTYWEHQGTATIETLGRTRTCKVVR